MQRTHSHKPRPHWSQKVTLSSKAIKLYFLSVLSVSYKYPTLKNFLNLLLSRLEKDRLQEEYDQLFADYDNLTRNYEELRVKFEKVGMFSF